MKQLKMPPVIRSNYGIILWMIFIFLFSHQVADDSSNLSGSIVDTIKPYAPSLADGILTFIVRKAAHITLYAVLGVLIYRFLVTAYTSIKKPVLWSVLAAGAYAVTDEIHQTFISGRSGEARDVLIDMVGALIGIGIYIWIRRILQSKRVHSNPHYKQAVRIGKKVLRYSPTAMFILLAASYVAALIGLLSTSIIPKNILLLIIAAITVATLLSSFSLVRYRGSSIVKRGLLLVIAGVLLLANSFIYTSAQATTKFISSLQSSTSQTLTYSVIAVRSKNISKLDTNMSAGYVTESNPTDAVATYLQNKTSLQPTAHENVGSLLEALESDQLQAGALRSGVLDVIEQNYLELFRDIVIIDTFTITEEITEVQAPVVDTTKPFAVYISGIDTYGPLAVTSRSDVNLIAVLKPAEKEMLLITTPRDYYVQLHGTTGLRDKLTHAGIYGIEMSKNSLEDLYQLDIDYTLRINFTSLLKLVDTLGGIEVQSDVAFSVGKNKFVVGTNNLNGAQALDFARARKVFKDGDRQRGKNQQKVLEAIVKKLSSPSVLLDYARILNSVEGSFETNASEQAINSLLQEQIRTRGEWRVTSVSAEGSDANARTYSGGSSPLYVMEPNTTSVDAIRNAVQGYLVQ